MLKGSIWWSATAKNRRGETVQFKITTDKSYSEERIVEIFSQTSRLTDLKLKKIIPSDLTNP